MTTLVKYEAAKHALAEAKAIDEVKKIHDVSAAMKAYARQAKDRQLEVDASEIRIRAERRLGEMIRTQKETVGLNQGAAAGGTKDGPRGNYEEPRDARPTLADVGVSKKLSSRSQAMAAIPEDEFEETLADHREQQQAVTAKTMEKLARQGERHTETYDVTDAEQYANMAIRQLQRIRNDDPTAKQELDRVATWIADKLSDL